MVPVLCISSDDVLYLYCYREDAFNGFKAIEWTHFQTENNKGVYFCKNVYGVTVLIICMLFNYALYFYKVS